MKRDDVLARIFEVSSLDIPNGKICRELSAALRNDRKEYNIGILEISANQKSNGSPKFEQ